MSAMQYSSALRAPRAHPLPFLSLGCTERASHLTCPTPVLTSLFNLFLTQQSARTCVEKGARHIPDPKGRFVQSEEV